MSCLRFSRYSVGIDWLYVHSIRSHLYIW